MIVFVSLALGRCCSGFVNQRSWLGLGGVLLVFAAGLAAYGINSAFGEPLGATPASAPPYLFSYQISQRRFPDNNERSDSLANFRQL